MARKSRHAMPPSKVANNNDAAIGLTPKALSKQEFGRRLVELMARENMNQAKLSRRSGLGRDSISTYVNGLCFPKPDSLKKIADVFGLQPQQLLPNSMASAMDSEHLAIEMKEAVGHPGKMWVRVNQMLDIKTAAFILDTIMKSREDEQK